MYCDIFSGEDFKMFLDQKSGLCISIFLPTDPLGRETQRDHILFKNLLKQARELLAEQKISPDQSAAILKPAYNLFEDTLFWSRQGRGLAVFIAHGFFRYFRMPVNFSPQLKLSDRFPIKPFLPLMMSNNKYYLLSLSHNQAKVFHGSRFGLNEIDVRTIPKSIHDSLKYEIFEEQVHYHAATAGNMHGGSAIFHGQGSGTDDDRKNELFMYFEKIDSGLSVMLAMEKAPLVLAGVEYLLDIYRKANKYSYLASEHIPGNPEQMRMEDMHEKARKILEPYFNKSLEEVVARYLHLTGTASPLALNNSDDIEKAAAEGRVDVLFVDTKTDDTDKIEHSIVNTLVNKGNIYAIENEKMPCRMPAAAILRY